MSQRPALEQDVIDFVRTVQEIFERQLELQKELAEIFELIAIRFESTGTIEDLSLTQFGVNLNSLKTTSPTNTKRNYALTQKGTAPSY